VKYENLCAAKISQDVDKVLTFLKYFYPCPAWVSANCDKCITPFNYHFLTCMMVGLVLSIKEIFVHKKLHL
jgi:hypothetical protein